MGRWLEVLYDILFEPRQAFAALREEPNLTAGVIAWCSSTIFPLWALYFGIGQEWKPFYLVFAVLQCMGGAVIWFAGTGLMHLCAELSGAQGSARTLLAALGFAQLPRLFLVPLWVLAAVLPGGAATAVMGLASMAIALWSLVLAVMALSRTYQLSIGRAAFLWLVPLGVLGLAMVLLVVMVSSLSLPWPVRSLL